MSDIPDDNQTSEEPVDFFKQKDVFGIDAKEPLNPNSTAPPAEVSELTPSPESEYQSPRNFLILCLFSFGAYLFFWFYKHWRYLKDEKEMDISPGMRSLFILLTGYTLFGNFKSLAFDLGYKNKTPYGLLFFLQCIITLSATLKEFVLISFVLIPLSFLLYVPALNMMNYYYLKVHPTYRVREKLGIDEIVFLAIIWLIIILATFNS